MTNRIDEMLRECERELGASLAAIEKTEKALKVSFPEDYIAVMTASNGIEGFVGKEYLAVFSVEEKIGGYSEISYDEYAEGVAIFANNGGGEGFGIVTSINPPEYICVPLGAWHKEDVIVLGHSFLEFLETISTGDYI